MGNCCNPLQKETNYEITKEDEQTNRKKTNTYNNSTISENTEKQLISNKRTDLPYQIFKLINSIRAEPEAFFEEARQFEDLVEPFGIVINKPDRPNSLIFDEVNSIKVENYLNEKRNNDKTNYEKESDIFNIINKKGELYFSFSDRHNIRENVLKLLDSNSGDVVRILTEKYSEIVVAVNPVEGTKKIIITCIFIYECIHIL